MPSKKAVHLAGSTPSKRREADLEPDRNVGLTNDGLVRMRRIAEALKVRLDRVCDHLYLLTDEIDTALGGNAVLMSAV